jgi:TonB-linked SusC/RagA family outer membrane protein
MQARNAFILVFLLLLSSVTKAQTSSISGSVTDSAGSAIAGATVSVKGTNTRTSTSNTGIFKIASKQGDVIVVSAIGYADEEVSVGTETYIMVSLKTTVNSLNDVVVVGYGTQKRKDVSGSVSTVNVPDAKKTATYDVAKMLQGQVAGVSVQGSGEPGAIVNVKIRGISTFGNNNPVYVVDGVILNPANGAYDFSPNDIESIQILKDATAGAIYGSRAANGIIIITTKKGASNTFKINYDGYYGFQNITKKLLLTDREQYQKITSAAEINAGLQVAPGNDPNSPQYIDNVNTNWQDEDFKTGNIQNHSLNFSGGGQMASYNVNMGYYDQTATLKGPQDYKRYSFDANMQGKKGIFSFGAKLAYTNSHKINNTYPHLHPAVGNAVTNLLIDIPTMPVYDSTREGGYGGTDNTIQKAICINPIGMNALITDYSDRYRMLASGWGQLELVKNLNYRLNISYDQLNYRDFFFEPTYDLGWYYTNNIAYMSQRTGTNSTGIIDNLLTYRILFGKSTVDALAGTSYTIDKYNNTFESAEGFTKPYFYTFSAADPSYPKAVTSYLETATLISYFGRINYNYNDRYLITANFRRDGSSKFSPANRFGNFGSVSGAWNVLSEKFITAPRFISSLKLRGGYGTLGNQNIGSYLYEPYVNQNASYLFGTTPVLAPGTTSTFVVDPNIKWEQKITSNGAIDIGFLNNSLLFTAEYFSNTSKDILVAVPIPLSVGSTGGPTPNSVTENAGSVRNQGIEFTLSYHHASGKFHYNISANMNTLQNKVLALGGNNNPIYGVGSKTEVGQPVGQLYGFVAEGIFKDAADVSSHATQTGAAPGDVKFKDMDGRDAAGNLTGKPDGQITDDDRVYLGNAIPNLYYGFNFDAAYKNFDFSFFLQGSSGNKVYNGVYRDLMAGQYTNHSIDELNYWTPTNTNTDVPRPIIYDPNQNDRFSTRFVEDGSYLKLQNAQIGYTFSVNTLNKTKVIKSFRIYASGQNLFTLCHYKGYDPDFISDGLFSRGYDWGSFPNPRTIMFGIQAEF